MSNIKLENLNLSELNILLSHLRMGEGYLKQQLNSHQLTNLLNLSSLTYEQLINVSSNTLEKSGNIALVINTVITSIFGAWMGFTGFMGMQLNSYSILCVITTIAVLFSVTVGFFSFRLTNQNAQSAIRNQRIHNLKLVVLKLIITKQEECVNSFIKYLNNSMIYIVDKSLAKTPYEINTFKKHVLNFENNEDYFVWFDEINKNVKIKTDVINEEQIYRFYSERLLKLLKKLHGIIELSFLIEAPQSPKSEDVSNTKDRSFIKLLSRPRIKTHRVPKHKTWIGQNYLALLAGLFPTLLGGFASMFVFLAGGPNLAKELGLAHLEQILRHPDSRIIEFSMAVCLTLYYGVSFMYNNYKNFIRLDEVEKTKHLLIKLEKKDIELKRQMTLLSQLKTQTKRIINIYTAIENIDKYKNTQKISVAPQQLTS